MKAAIPVLRVGKTLLVTIQQELHDAAAEAFQQDLLQAIESTGSVGLVIDISGLEVVDSYVARVLTDTAKMARLMGADTVVVGMRPEVAATLVRMGYSMGHIKTALNLEDGLALMAGPDRLLPKTP